MKSKYKNILISTAIAAVLGTTGAAFAHGGAYSGNWKQGAQVQQGCGGAGPSMGMMGHRDMMSHGGMKGTGGRMSGMQQGMGFGMGLDLSDEQKAEMGKIREEFLPLMGELRGKMQANHEQMQVLRQSGTVDEATITTLADQKGELIAEMIKMHSRHQARMQTLLTDEQREQMRKHPRGMGLGPMGG